MNVWIVTFDDEDYYSSGDLLVTKQYYLTIGAAVEAANADADEKIEYRCRYNTQTPEDFQKVWESARRWDGKLDGMKMSVRRINGTYSMVSGTWYVSQLEAAA